MSDGSHFKDQGRPVGLEQVNGIAVCGSWEYHLYVHNYVHVCTYNNEHMYVRIIMNMQVVHMSSIGA